MAYYFRIASPVAASVFHICRIPVIHLSNPSILCGHTYNLKKSILGVLLYTAFVLTSCLPVASNISFLLQPVDGQQREKEVIPDYLDATFSEKQTGEGHSHSVEASACVKTAQTTSR